MCSSNPHPRTYARATHRSARRDNRSILQCRELGVCLEQSQLIRKFGCQFEFGG